MSIQYLPAYLIKQLATPEAIAHESVRRKLKASVADTTKAVLRFRSTPKPTDMLSVRAARNYEEFTYGNANALKPELPPLLYKTLDTEEKLLAEVGRRYNRYIAYIAERNNDSARRDALLHAEDAARQAYNKHLASKLE